jgi:amino-acid N-acetyltransferase
MIRKARVRDIPAIQKLINGFAQKDLMLPRSLNELYEHIRDYWVCEINGKIAGCSALHISWDDLAEVKSLAVALSHQKKGIGNKLVAACMKEAKNLGAKRVFVLTYKDKFFAKLGFSRVAHAELPHKVWAECINCCKFPNCQEIAMVRSL